jgi:hypothetical protein
MAVSFCHFFADLMEIPEGKLLNLEETRLFLDQFANENGASLAFMCNMEGGVLCASDPAQGKMAIEALSVIWQTLLPPDWSKLYFEWETAYICLINCGSWVFGLEQKDPNPLTFGMLHQKARICADYLKSQLD